jgi:cbb3-type cytochrome oxidase cytochrome c subunit
MHLLMAMLRYRVVLMIVGIIILLGCGGYVLLVSRHYRHRLIRRPAATPAGCGAEVKGRGNVYIAQGRPHTGNVDSRCAKKSAGP